MASPNTQTVSEELVIAVIRGFKFPASARFTRENIESILNYQPLDDDIILSTYPKAGTTWGQYIIWEILNDGKPLPSLDEMRRTIPFMERVGAKVIEKLPSPRIMKCHLPYDIIPKNPQAKYIYVIRNPSDVVVSFYFYLRNHRQAYMDFDYFFDQFITGDMPYGDYLEHALSWYKQKDIPNVLILSYDRMIKDPRGGLLRVAAFLGEEYLQRLNADEALVERILEHTSFGFMKKKLAGDSAEKPGESTELKKEPTDADFFRKGTVGDWKNHLSEDQRARMDARIAEVLKGTDMEKLWKF